MELTIQESALFCKEHIKFMCNLKDQLRKFCANKDEYVVKNSTFVMEYLTQYEEHNLKSYNSGGYAY